MKSPRFLAVGCILFALASLPTVRKVCLHVFFLRIYRFDTNLPYLMVCSVVPILIYLFLSCVLPIFTNFRMLFIHVFHVCSTICPHVPTVNTFNTHSFSHTFPQTSFIIPCVNHILEVSINVGYPKNRCFFLHIFIGKSHEISGWSLGFAASQVEDAQLPEEVHQAFDSMGISGWIYGIYGRCSVVADGSEIWFLYSCYMVSVGFYMFFLMVL